METTGYDLQTLADIVTADFRAAEVFKNYGLDFCCGGNTLFTNACLEKGLESGSVASDLQSMVATAPPDPTKNFNEWPLDFLCDYIINTHHKTTASLLPQITEYSRKIATVHGMRHPELQEIVTLFSTLRNELELHLRAEEETLFPTVKTMVKQPTPAAREIIAGEISRMAQEHIRAGAVMDRINTLSGGYALPEDACPTYLTAYKLLRQFEDDLHVHVHLENNILYPKSVAL